ncbi:alpha/beta hydrolase [Cellvibrio sp. NN19]|uniref:alpha/beta hydrolase n=1 Tax=Cellvibrio chitinivorans TaxID=3102792 RepID=UPI002B4009B8|nr:alpha/beta hydrolase [Cellvibrio sp. NN19]
MNNYQLDQTANDTHDAGRRQLLKLTGTGIAAAYVASAIAAPASASTPMESNLKLSEDWDKTFPKSKKVDHKKVTFINRYGITLAADLYSPKGAASDKLAALAVSGPFGAIKEQSSGLYAQTMAERGFITLAFDPSYTGESGGEPRHVASPDINTEDFSAAVDFLGLLPNVDRERIGIIGICGWGGMALNAAAIDKRIKAVVASTMYDMSRVMSKGYNDSTTKAQRSEALVELGQQRWKDSEAGKPALGPVSLELKGGEPQFVLEYAGYYKSKERGFHPRAINSNSAWTITNPLSFMNMPLLSYIEEISPRPLLLIHGEIAHSRYFSETAYKAAAEPKELLIIKGANHTDLYDQLDVIPFNRLTDFFQTHLNVETGEKTTG